MTIGIDIDETITQTRKKVQECLTNFTDNCTDYKMLEEDKYHEFLNLYEGFIAESCELKEGVVEAFKYFRERNWKIIIITARDRNHCTNIFEITKNYLHSHGLEYDKIIFEESAKGNVALLNNVDVFIDDKEIVLDDIARVGIECIRISEDRDSKYLTFSKWSDIVKYLDAKEAGLWTRD